MWKQQKSGTCISWLSITLGVLVEIQSQMQTRNFYIFSFLRKETNRQLCRVKARRFCLKSVQFCFKNIVYMKRYKKLNKTTQRVFPLLENLSGHTVLYQVGLYFIIDICAFFPQWGFFFHFSQNIDRTETVFFFNSQLQLLKWVCFHWHAKWHDMNLKNTVKATTSRTI